MTITTTAVDVTYSPDGSTTGFALPFAFADAAHVKVRLNGVVLNSGYSITGAGSPSGGALLFDTAPVAGTDTLYAYRQTPLTQQIDAQNNATIFASVLAEGLDLGVLRAQEVSAYLNRVIAEAGDSIGLIGKVSYEALALESGAALVGFITDADGAVYETAEQIFQERLSLASFGAVGDGVVDDTDAIQAALDASLAKGISLFIPEPPVRYVVTSQLEILRSVFDDGVFAPGLRLFGCGPKISKFDNRVADGAMLNVESSTAGKFLFGLDLLGFSIETTTNPVNSTGIRLRSAYNVAIKQVEVKGLTGDGINITCEAGDADASNMVFLEHVRCWNNLRWGLDITSGEGSNEISFVTGHHVFLQGNGVSAGTYPPVSGGLRAKNQLLRIGMSAFTTNKNVGVFLTGGAGAPNGALFELCAIENNGGRSVLITGGQGIRFSLCQIYCNLAQSPSVATHGFHIDGTNFLIENVRIDQTIVRCTADSSPMTMFKVEGTNAKRNTIRATDTSWISYDAAGQVRFDGFQFDAVPEECQLTILSATSLALRPDAYADGGGNKTAYRRRYSVGGLSSSGEIVALAVEGAGGIGISNSGLAANTIYNVYLYDNSNVPALELSTTAPDYDFTLGYNVKTGDPTRLYKGFVRTDGSSQFPTVGGQFMDPLRLGGAQLGVKASLFFTDIERGLCVKSGASLPSFLGDRTYFFPAHYSASKVVDLPSVAAGGVTTFTMDNTNGVLAALGDDQPRATCDAPLNGLILFAQFTATSVITVTVFNPTAAAIDLGSTTFRCFYNRR